MSVGSLPAPVLMPQLQGHVQAPSQSQSTSAVSSAPQQAFAATSASSATSTPASSAPKPNLSLAVDSPPSGSWSPNLNGSNGGLAPWQQHVGQSYSELSRLPSASHKFGRPTHAGIRQQRDWPSSVEGAHQRFMTPLPSPAETRSRSISDAASEASAASGTSGVSIASTDGGQSLAERMRSSTSANHAHEGRTAPARTRTMQFFDTMDAAFSPPPPPRIASADYDPSRSNLYASTSSLPDTSVDSIGSTSSSNTAAPPLQSLILPTESLKAGSTSASDFLHSPPATARPASSTSDVSDGFPVASTSASAHSGNASTSSTITVPIYKPLSNLPSAIRSEGGSAAVSRHNPGLSSLHTHTRTRSGSSGPLVLGRQTVPGLGVVHDSPLPSPTDSQASAFASVSKWAREPPSRLPTLPPDPSDRASRRSPSLPSGLSAATLAEGSETAAVEGGSTPANVTPAQEAEPGHVLNGCWEVVRPLGMGAFSKVVLARRIAPTSSGTSSVTSSVTNSTHSSPTRKQQQLQNLGHRKNPSTSSSMGGSTRGLVKGLGLSTLATAHQESSISSTSPQQEQLVALKMISRSHIKKNDRMRISIVREVEVLKHIRHPSLVHLTSSFDTPFHTCLVLEYSQGGELFDLLANHHEEMSEALTRRIFGELADALGWMHSIGLVHRDIKLENILLASHPFRSSTVDSGRTAFPAADGLPEGLPQPFVKLTDFGLSRFIDPSSPYLETRCGSEEYAAPELIMGKRYDGRQTDAWALGVVLFALITGYLPFVEDGAAGVGAHDTPSKNGVSPSAKGSAKSRRNYLLRIAKGEYAWPEREEGQTGSDATRMINEDVKSLVGGLLARDPKKRTKTEDIWDAEWMKGPGAPEKRSLRGGGLEGVAVMAFGQDDEAMVRAEVPEH